LVGPIIINGPATANYDIDLGALPLTDWFSEPMFEILASRPTVPPTSQTILVNGTSSNNLSKINFTPGKTHRLRLINTGINNNFHVGIDQHKLQVIAVDFVPVTPFTVDTLNIAVGQRYDVLVKADQTVANYYFRIGTGGGVCDGPNAQAAAGTTQGAIVTYDGAGSAAPTSQAITLPSGCDEVTGINTFISTTVPAPPGAPTTLALTLDTSVGTFWKVNGQSIDVDWNTPTLSYVMNGTFTLPQNDNGVTIDAAGWAYFLITNDTPLPHRKYPLF
jgi:FtsP/CotA-like multicopper oxidase with cupredoxin domain